MLHRVHLRALSPLPRLAEPGRRWVRPRLQSVHPPWALPRLSFHPLGALP